MKGLELETSVELSDVLNIESAMLQLPHMDENKIERAKKIPKVIKKKSDL